MPIRTEDELRLFLLNNSSFESQTGCLIANFGKHHTGYSVLNHKRKQYRAHRMSYLLFVGPIAEGMLICHHCDNRACINPNHLYQGTDQDNVNDRTNRKRLILKKPTHCKRGHEFTPENTINRLYMGRNKRRCRLCAKMIDKKRIRKIS
jgi:HNH endonuclease